MRVLKSKADDYVSANAELAVSLMVLALLVAVFGFLVFFLGELPYALVGIPLMFFAYALGFFTEKKRMLWMSGLVGESAVTKALSKLSDSYCLINGVVVPPNRGDTDHILVGPNGVFVFESKHYGGVVECEGDSWVRYKVSKRGKKYDFSVGSPSRQVKRNAKVLKDFLLQHSSEVFGVDVPHIWVFGAVVFTNKNVKLVLKNPAVDVVRVEDLVDYVRNKEPVFSLGDESIKRMCEVILKYAS